MAVESHFITMEIGETRWKDDLLSLATLSSTCPPPSLTLLFPPPPSFPFSLAPFHPSVCAHKGRGGRFHSSLFLLACAHLGERRGRFLSSFFSLSPYFPTTLSSVEKIYCAYLSSSSSYYIAFFFLLLSLLLLLLLLCIVSIILLTSLLFSLACTRTFMQ